MTAYTEGKMSIFLRIFTIALDEYARPVSCHDHLTPREAAEPVSVTWSGGEKHSSCPHREPNSEFSVSNCSLVTVSNESTRLTYKNCGSDNHISPALGWLT
jgi:hypothetical protein